VVTQPPRSFSDEPDLSPFLKALDDVRRKAAREGWCYWHVQAIIVAIDQHAEAATGNREYFLINRIRSADRVEMRLLRVPLGISFVQPPALQRIPTVLHRDVLPHVGQTFWSS
jgi:hypothetical protein